jgi:hypothetical protein
MNSNAVGIFFGLAAGANAVVFNLRGGPLRWMDTATGRVAGVLSASLWIAIILSGRWIAFATN